MSLGIAFEAAQVTPGAAGAIEPLIECCPPGSTIEQCQAKCGDGKVSGDEICDTAIAATATGGCPTTCPAVNACTPRIVAGSACTSHCVDAPITTPKSGDGCCPLGADATQDDDCPAICGNGVIEPGETCDPMTSCMSCGSTDACLTPMASGSAQTCDAACKLVEVTACKNGDQCCPSGCNRASDDDCPAGCGNGVLEAGETCEANSATPCPATCDDGKACTVDQRTGSVGNCNVVCTHTAITQVHDGDGCCPPGANLNTDKDCMAICGNKVVETGEQCDDGNQIAGDGCSNCKTETQEQICRVKIGKSDACALCSCANCTQDALACYGASSAHDVMLCDAVAQCGISSHCHGIECYCGIGQTDAFVCLLVGANGPCKPQIEQAANSTDPLTIQSASTDSSSPLGRADTLGECAYTKCATECGF
jgi:cysteine-rich repeat protein